MKRLTLLAILLITFSYLLSAQTLRSTLGDSMLICAAVSDAQVRGEEPPVMQVLCQQFNAVVGENCMKAMYLQPREGEYDFRLADKFVDYAIAHNLEVIGHCLIWHSQPAEWMFYNEAGKLCKPEVLRERMRKHIYTVMGHFKGRVHRWDVVNEAIMEDGTFRNSKFYQILGEEFFTLAFQYAHEADPTAELYYNDYNEWYPKKRATVCRLVKSLRDKGLRIDAIGLQGHIDMTSPTIEEYQATVDDYRALGLKVMLTEMEISALPQPKSGLSANISNHEEYRKEIDPYPNGLPAKVSRQWNDRMVDIFRFVLRNADVFSRVTLWGVSDKSSWKNNFPVFGRTDYPLLFDRQLQPKPAVEQIIKMAQGQ